tara:strand:+ start:8894 stop:9907 length:1014 start_codon:yes stop_codon:yes gene_type:complete
MSIKNVMIIDPVVMPNDIFTKSLYLIAACLFSGILVSIDWEALRGYQFIDRTNYYVYFKFEENVLAYTKTKNWYDFITTEYLWQVSIPFILKNTSVPISVIFNAISFFCISTFSWFVLRYGKWWLLFLLINPLLITLSFDQMRMALAFSLLLWAYMLPRKLFIISVFLCVIAPFFHTASIIFILLFIGLVFLSTLYKRNIFNANMVLLTLIAVGAFMSFLFGDLLQQVLSVVGDRRADRYLIDTSSGIKYTSFWFLFLCVCFFQGPNFVKSLQHNYCIIILSFVTFNLIFGGYSLRFLAVSLPIMLITLTSTNRNVRYLLVTAYLAYTMLQWSYWIH